MTNVKTSQKPAGEEPVTDDLQRQRQYIEKLKQMDFNFGIVVADAFVRGMRDIGYKSNATALNELIDNAIQAGAKKINIHFGYEAQNRQQGEPDMIAIIDDGHGMDPEMIRAAVVWGGTHREDDRNGFGRYGYGLPSSCVSMGRRFTVMSKVEGGDWSEVAIDLDEIARGVSRNETGQVVAPKPKRCSPPSWLKSQLEAGYGDFTHGTIVIIDKIDRERLTWKKSNKLKQELLEQFGVTYRNYLNAATIRIEDTNVEPIDPLFTTPGFRYYDLDSDRAEALEPLLIEIKDRNSRDVLGTVRVRFSYMPPTFLRIPEDKPKEKGGKNNARFKIRKENNGVIVCRAARQIDVVTTNSPYHFQNDDRYIGIEIDFPPVLDEEFSITTSKQQVRLSDRLWDILQANGLDNAISGLRRRYHNERAALKQKREDEPIKRPSEIAIEEAQKFISTRPPAEAPEQTKKKEIRLGEEAQKKSDQTGVPVEEVKRHMVLESKGRPYKVEFVDHPGAPFYRMDQVGGQKILFINRSHRFYQEIYMGPESTPRLRYCLEVLLFVLGDAELKAKPEIQLFYETERMNWTSSLSIALNRLSEWDNVADSQQSMEEIRVAEEATTNRSRKPVASA